MARLISDAHDMGNIVKQGIKCTNCTHSKAIVYTKGIKFCWHCKQSTLLTQEQCDEINNELKELT
jgi:hypothetical protein